MLALVYLVSATGVLPSPAVVVRWFGRITFERYPCEDCACGCASAFECWTACCCHSTTQRLAWAIREGVTPPAAVEFTDAEWIAAANNLRPGTAKCMLCVAAIKSQLSEGIGIAPESPEASCCAGPEREAQCSDPTESCCETPRVCGNQSGPASTLPCASALSCKRQMPMQAIAPQPSTPRDRIALTEPDVEPVKGCARPAPVRVSTRAIECDDPPPRC